MVERKVRLRSRPVWFLPIRVSGSIRLAVRTNRQAVEALNTVVGYAVVAAATINLEAIESLTVFLGQLLLSPDEGALIVLLEADLDIRGKAAPAVAWVIETSDSSAERRLSRGATEAKVHQKFGAADPVHAVAVGVVVECLQDAPLQVADSGYFLHILLHQLLGTV